MDFCSGETESTHWETGEWLVLSRNFLLDWESWRFGSGGSRHVLTQDEMGGLRNPTKFDKSRVLGGNSACRTF